MYILALQSTFCQLWFLRSYWQNCHKFQLDSLRPLNHSALTANFTIAGFIHIVLYLTESKSQLRIPRCNEFHCIFSIIIIFEVELKHPWDQLYCYSQLCSLQEINQTWTLLLYSFFTPSLLLLYSSFTPSVLLLYSSFTPSILLLYSFFTPSLLLLYSFFTPSSLLLYSFFTPSSLLLYSFFNPSLLLLYSFFTPSLLLLYSSFTPSLLLLLR